MVQPGTGADNTPLVQGDDAFLSARAVSDTSMFDGMNGEYKTTTCR